MPDLPDGSVHFFFSDQRNEQGADQGGLVLAELEEGQAKPNDSIVCPGMEAPVHEGGTHRKVRSLCRTGLNAGSRAEEVGHGFCRTIEDQTDAHAAAEEHCKPGGIGILRARIIRAEADFTVLAEGDIQDEEDEDRHHQHVKPSEVNRDRVEEPARRAGEGVGEENTPDRQKQADHQRGQVDGV